MIVCSLKKESISGTTTIVNFLYPLILNSVLKKTKQSYVIILK